MTEQQAEKPSEQLGPHALLPLAVEKRDGAVRIISVPTGALVMFVASYGRGQGHSKFIQEAEAMAAFVVRAVNCNGDLVEALKTALSHHADPDAVSGAQHRQMMNAGITALKAAGVQFPWEGEATHA